jgi:hypothetical protein
MVEGRLLLARVGVDLRDGAGTVGIGPTTTKTESRRDICALL